MSVTEAMGQEGEEQEENDNHNNNHESKSKSNSPSEVAEITEPTKDQVEEQQQQEYSWPVIRFDVPPHRTYHFYNQFRNSPNPNNFLKAIKWYFCVFLFVFLPCCFYSFTSFNFLTSFLFFFWLHFGLWGLIFVLFLEF